MIIKKYKNYFWKKLYIYNIKLRTWVRKFNFHRKISTDHDNKTCCTSSFFQYLLLYIYNEREDLKKVFDISKENGKNDFDAWLIMHGSGEYHLPVDVYPDRFLHNLSKNPNIKVKNKALQFIKERSKPKAEKLQSNIKEYGANLIGYCKGDFGMGEHVRMVIRSFASVNMPFVAIDQPDNINHTEQNHSVDHWIKESLEYKINIFHVNPDSLPKVLFHYVKDCRSFNSTTLPKDTMYNIGYWAWELSNVPNRFQVSVCMVNEIWAISNFVADAYRGFTNKPVFTMPLAVHIPDFKREYNKSFFNLDKKCFHFLFVFDSSSYIERKNPLACIESFKLAFPDKSKKVRLVLKTMNCRDTKHWSRVLKEANNDKRIIIIDDNIPRDDVLGLIYVCDSFISLHRSEGFGRCIAESMLLGRPAIVTNYSGNTDFCNNNNSCLVDYNLIEVESGSYTSSKDQVWADPDICNAAHYMKKLVKDKKFYRKISKNGQKYIRENFSENSVGKNYKERIDQINSDKTSFKNNENEILGHIDSTSEIEILHNSIDILGWAASNNEIEQIKIYANGVYMANALHGIIRSDVHKFFPDILNSSYSGFAHRLNSMDYKDGLDLSVVIYDKKGNSKLLAKRVKMKTGNTYSEWLSLNSKPKIKIKKTFSKVLFSYVSVIRGGEDLYLIKQSLKILSTQLQSNFEIALFISHKVNSKKVKDLISEFGSIDIRVKYIDLPTWSDACSFCKGGYLGLFDPGDLLDNNLSSVMTFNLNKNKGIDLIYCDEDLVWNNKRNSPVFKPAWSPIYLESYNYIGKSWFIKKDVLSRQENLPILNKKNDHALLINLSKLVANVCHIPMVLYSGCQEYKSIVVEKPALSKHSKSKSYNPLVSIIIPTCFGDTEIIEKCFSSLKSNTDYTNVEIIVIANNVKDLCFGQNFMKLWPLIIFLEFSGDFNWSKINNYGVEQSSGELLLFLNDDTEFINSDWLDLLVESINDKRIGVISPLLLYPNHAIQHAGIYFVNYGGGARHSFQFSFKDERIKPMIGFKRELSALTGACLMTKREVFNSVNGFDESFPIVANDTDFNLRIREKGYSCVLEPESIVIHNEGVSRHAMSESADVALFWSRWEDKILRCDLYSNPNIDNKKDDWSIKFSKIGGHLGRCVANKKA
jgi:GT2 family glycosyltransferase/glycosyltransferase involved in cell wall biosynthesis